MNGLEKLVASEIMKAGANELTLDERLKLFTDIRVKYEQNRDYYQLLMDTVDQLIHEINVKKLTDQL